MGKWSRRFRAWALRHPMLGGALLGYLGLLALKGHRCPRCNYPLDEDGAMCSNCNQPLNLSFYFDREFRPKEIEVKPMNFPNETRAWLHEGGGLIPIAQDHDRRIKRLERAVKNLKRKGGVGR